MTTGNIHDFLRGSKDVAIAVAVRSFFNSKYSRIGQMSDVAIDTTTREVRVRLELVGEPTPVEIHVGTYNIEQHGDQATLTISDATASREWITELLRQFVVGRPIAIPERAAAIVKLLA